MSFNTGVTSNTFKNSARGIALELQVFMAGFSTNCNCTPLTNTTGTLWVLICSKSAALFGTGPVCTGIGTDGITGAAATTIGVIRT